MKKLIIMTVALAALLLSAGPGRAELLIQSKDRGASTDMVFTIVCKNYREDVVRESGAQFRLPSDKAKNCVITWPGSNTRLSVSDGEVYHFRNNSFTRIK